MRATMPESSRSDQRVLCALALGEQRQCLAGDVGLEVRRFLMRLEGGLVTEQLVEQELRRIVLGARDQEHHGAFLALRLGQEAVEDAGDLVGLAVLGLPLCNDQKSAPAHGVADGPFIDGICVHVSLSLGLACRWTRYGTDRGAYNSMADEGCRKWFDRGRSESVVPAGPAFAGRPCQR